MKLHETVKKFAYVLTNIVMVLFLFGCNDKGSKITVFEGLPESPYITEMKTAVENKKPLAIAFTAEWCPHCKKYKPEFFAIKGLFEEKVSFVNIDVDDANGATISDRFQVRGIPTTAFVRADGSVYKVQVGEIGKEDLTSIINDLIKSKKKKRREPLAPFPIESKAQQPPEPKQEVEDKAPQEIIKENSDEQSETLPGEEESVEGEETKIEENPVPEAEDTSPDDTKIPSEEAIPESPDAMTGEGQ